MRKMNMKCIIKLMLKMSTLRRIMKLKRLKRLHIMMISQNLIRINKEITKSIRKQAEATEEVEEVAKEEFIVVVKVGHVETKVKEEVVVTIVGEVEDLPTKTMKALSSKLVVKRSNSVVIAEEEIVEIEVTEVTEVTGVTEVTEVIVVVTDSQEVVEEIVQEEKEEAEVKAEVVTEVVRQVKLTTKLPLNLIGTS